MELALEDLQQVGFELLEQSPAGARLREAAAILDDLQARSDRLQEDAAALVNDGSGTALKALRFGTVLILEVMGHLAAIPRGEKLEKSAWIDIASKVEENAILREGWEYSAYVFSAYADNIETAASQFGDLADDRARGELHEICGELRRNTELLKSGELAEPAYVEDCLWLSLEGIIKMLALQLSCAVGEEYGLLARAAAAYAFEYARYCMYSREQQLLTEYLEHQKTVDAELQAKLDDYRKQLESESRFFETLIDNAFAPGMRANLRASADLARGVGVREEEILDSIESVDDFFLN